ncbi:ethanolamine ammonia-lyase subunit EutB [Hyalangium rubrum]|uniref:Ethanolamine ammonia-lyase subunit EutB n=1 Tax=Hyalangium rubrum TaxID=3103134 RepID=A0ABU5GUP8_9BACT|nr:ethanolamine ammonia-lyase subunit EutB [Hyalangium sp. s54d21]MDY7224912.1 ethanolamine ammonia-lyase subunit EutB [Hyalangium sp. s54d21]
MTQPQRSAPELSTPSLPADEAALPKRGAVERGVSIPEVRPEEDVFGYLQRVRGAFEPRLYQQLLGAANAYKEGDEAIGVAAADEVSRANARALLSRTRLGDLHAHPPLEDRLYAFMLEAIDAEARASTASWTVGQLKDFLLSAREEEIKAACRGLGSDAIACVVKLMSDAELTHVGSKVFHPLPGSHLGARGYLGARIQPNSPTDHPEDIRWQVFNGWSFALGDVVLGTNPVSSSPESVGAVEAALHDILVTFGLEEVMPHCVLSHIDIQARVEELQPGTTGIWFQSIAGTEAANRTFDVTLERMVEHAARRTGRFGLYFETGQGADATNGQHAGCDMVLLESRKYGFARALKRRVALAQMGAGKVAAPWVHVNDVAGFIGPEVFRSKEQLVRCCLEDIVMGKLHGLMIGLDICSTLHMDVSLDDLGWCQEQIAPASPGYLMALPTRNDPMLSYLTTAFQDHVRLRERFGLKVDDRMWAFFQELGVIDAQGKPTEHFGDPRWVYAQYRRRKGDTRPEAELLAEAERQMAEVRARGVALATGYGEHPWDLEPGLDREVRGHYEDAKRGIWTELSAAFIETIPQAVRLRTQAADRRDYILHPVSGERLAVESVSEVQALRSGRDGKWDVQLVISDGLDPRSLMDAGHLAPFLESLRRELEAANYRVASEHLVVRYGRVRAGYQIGELLFGDAADTLPRALIHVVGERPGSGHHSYSAYLTAPTGQGWAGKERPVDHDLTRVIAGISDTSVRPEAAAREAVRILGELCRG